MLIKANGHGSAAVIALPTATHKPERLASDKTPLDEYRKTVLQGSLARRFAFHLPLARRRALMSRLTPDEGRRTRLERFAPSHDPA